MTSPRPLHVVDAQPDPMTALRSALVAGQLNPAQAAALDALLATLVQPPEPTLLHPGGQVSNDEVLTRYLRVMETRWRPQTLRVRELQLQRIARALPAPLVDVTEDEVCDWRDQLTGRPETVASYISSARGIFRWMAGRARPRLRLDDPTILLDRPRIPEAGPRPIASDQYDLALACAVTQPDLYVWLGLMGCSGLRCCEIAWMRGTDVEERDDGSGLLHIEGKGGKRRTVPAGPHLMAVLRGFVDRAGAGPVFTRPTDRGAYSPNGVSARVNRFLHELRLPATAHQLRHRWAGDYHELDPDLFRQAKLMGHSSVNTTQRYTAVSPTEAAAFIAQITNRRMGGRR